MKTLITLLLASLMIVPSFAAEGAAPPATAGFGSTLIFLVVFVLIFYFLLIRPQSKRAKEHRRLMSELATGDEVSTNGGILGKVTAVDENIITIEIAAGTEIKVQKQAVSAVLPKGTL